MARVGLVPVTGASRAVFPTKHDRGCQRVGKVGTASSTGQWDGFLQVVRKPSWLPGKQLGRETQAGPEPRTALPSSEDTQGLIDLRALGAGSSKLWYLVHLWLHPNMADGSPGKTEPGARESSLPSSPSTPLIQEWINPLTQEWINPSVKALFPKGPTSEHRGTGHQVPCT